jgi:RHS repeat-associated protein
MTPAVKFHLGNHLGSSNVVIDDSGGFINREEYTPYGETSFGSFAKKRYRFTGKERDEESGLYYHGVRYYAPWLVRWGSCDPAGPVDGLNLYRYARSNPLRLVDPTGTQSAPKKPEQKEGKKAPPASASTAGAATKVPVPWKIEEEGKLYHLAWFGDYGPPNDHVEIRTNTKMTYGKYRFEDAVTFKFGGRGAAKANVLQFVKLTLTVETPDGTKTLHKEIPTTSSLKRGESATTPTDVWETDSPDPANPFYPLSKRSSDALIAIDRPTVPGEFFKDVLTYDAPDATSATLTQEYRTYFIQDNKAVYEIIWTARQTYTVKSEGPGKTKAYREPLNYEFSSKDYVKELPTDFKTLLDTEYPGNKIR